MIKQKFSKTQDEVLTQAYLFQSELVLDQADFTAASPLFAPPFAANFLTDIEAADAIPTNEDDLNAQTLLSADVEAKMVEARAQYQKLMLYIGLAWTNVDTMLKTFGNNLYETARYSPLKMINLLQSSYLTANSVTYKATLIAAGFLQVDITLLDTLAGELTTKYNAQQDFIRHSFKRGEERVVAFNKVWDSMVMISNTSKLIFKASPAKIEFYLLYPYTGSIGPLTAVTGLAYNMLSQIFTWGTQANATSYSLEASSDNNNFVEIYSGAATTFTYNAGGAVRYYRCRARNSGGFGDYSNVINVTYSETLDVPDNMVVIFSQSPNQIHLTWDAVTGAESYLIYGCEVNIGDLPTGFAMRGSSLTNSYTENVILEKRYYYVVYPIAGAEVGLPSQVAFKDTI